MSTRPGRILRHAAGCCVCTVLMAGIVYAVMVALLESGESAGQGGAVDSVHAAAQFTLRVLMFLPDMLRDDHSLGQHSKVVWSWINILLDGCVLYILWSVARRGRRKRHGEDARQGPGALR